MPTDTKPSLKSKRFRLDVDIAAEEPLTIEEVRAIANNILDLHQNILAVRIFDRDYKLKKS